MSDLWYYNNEVFEPDEDQLKSYVGFVYQVTEKSTGMKYIGKKFFWRQKTLPITKTRKRRKKVLVESDWRTYCGSSETVKQILNESGLNAFDREILHLCKTKGECSYMEAKIQFDRDVLLRDDYYNGIIQCRINRKHLKMEPKS
jgi:hypothetical protein